MILVQITPYQTGQSVVTVLTDKARILPRSGLKTACLWLRREGPSAERGQARYRICGMLQARGNAPFTGR